MTAKEKAKELESMHWHKLYEIQSRIIPTELAEQAKQCALICVDVILNDVGAKDWELDTGTNTNYWQEVKQEIEKL
tara:strand:- start:527 stop:754 length:228 start_codon:yes stop_codon:yes gene_type:complete